MAIVHDLIIESQTRPLVGSVPVPGDEAIAGLALVAAALAEGTSELRGLSASSDTGAMVEALRALGVSVNMEGKGTARVKGVGLLGLTAAREPVDCGGSVRTMRLLAAVLAGHPFETVLRGDAALLGTSVVGLVGALRGRGAVIEGAFSTREPGLVTPPLVVGPLGLARRLSGIEYELASAAPEVKEALLLSGLAADESTYVRERIVSRDHAERMLQALDVPLSMAGPIVHLDVEGWTARLPAFDAELPGDFSASALFLAAASVVPASRVCIRRTGLNPTRTGLFDLLRQMGASVENEVRRSALGEPEGVACVTFAPLRGVTMAGEVLGRASAELPLLAAIAARARGETEISDVRAVLGDTGSRNAIDRLAAVLRGFGVEAEAGADALLIRGRPEGSLGAVDFDSEGDPDVAAAATVLGLVAEGHTRVRSVDGLARRFPRFVGTLRALGVEARVEQRTV
jgi:3-phosphoshikimate 1-carboxyvinyltransferase